MIIYREGREVQVAAARVTRPWFVTGGATPETVPTIAKAGGRRFVAVRWLTEAADPEAAARQLRQMIERSRLTP